MELYTLDNSGEINFAESPVGCAYHLTVFINQKGRIVFKKAAVIE